MLRLLISATALLAVVGGALGFGITGPETARGDVAGVYSNVPVFTPGQVVTITVQAEDDDGMLLIDSSLSGSQLTVINCSGIGADQKAGECDGSGMYSVSGQSTSSIRMDTITLDEDRESELLTVTLTLLADCDSPTVVTISGDQPGNVGPDDVTINCIPPTPSPTPTQTATASPTATSTTTPAPTATPQPPAAPTSTPFSEIRTTISPPNTGDGGLR